METLEQDQIKSIAATLGRLGGLKRAQNTTPEQRKAWGSLGGKSKHKKEQEIPS